MSESDIRVAGKRGKLAARLPDMGTLRDYMKGSLPTPPKTFDYAPMVTGGFPMALNDSLGNCTIAGAVHFLQLAYAEIGETFAYPGDDAVRSTYMGLTGGADNGLVETDVLGKWMTDGLFGTKIAGYAPVNPKDDTEMRIAAYLFGAIYLGLEMPASAETQFEDHQPWSLTIPKGQPVGGHCVVASGANYSGIDLITWGAETTMTWDFWDTYGSEAYVIIPQAFVEIDHGPLYNINILQLQEDLKAI